MPSKRAPTHRGTGTLIPPRNRRKWAQAVVRAVKHCGSTAALAREMSVYAGIEVHQPSVWHYMRGTRLVPAELVIPMERATGGAVRRGEIRPDIYPPDDIVA